MTGLLLIVITFSACKKYLDVKSDARLLVPESLADAQGLLDDVTSMNNQRTPGYSESSADDYFLTESALNALGYPGKDIYTWQKYEYRYPNDWSSGYLPIYNTNLSIELLNNVRRNAQNALDWDNAHGSALFYRSYYNFWFTTQYGAAYDPATSWKDLGIVLRSTSNFNEKSVRATVSESLERAIADATQASGLLPDYPLILQRPSKAAAYAQLARIYLYMRDYEKALKFADECLKIKSDLMDFNNDPDILGLDANITFRKLNKETIFYTEMYSGSGLHSGSSARIDTTLYASYSGNDLRKRAYFKSNGGYYQFKGSYTGASALFSGIATDEVFLIRSECKAQTGDVTGAMTDLNLLLKKRWNNTVTYVPVVATDKADAIKKIRLERRKELLLRGLRWQDIKRFNKEGSGIRLRRLIKGENFYLEPNAAFYALPLPADIIEQAQIPQNP